MFEQITHAVGAVLASVAITMLFGKYREYTATAILSAGIYLLTV